jgi:hypothetical protein
VYRFEWMLDLCDDVIEFLIELNLGFHIKLNLG